MSTIKNLDALFSKLDAISESSASILTKGMSKGAKLIQGSAKLLCPVKEGSLRNSIRTKTSAKDGIVESTIYTNNSHAAFVEFGTGPRGAASAKELPEGLEIQYKNEGWWIPVGDGEGEISQEDVEKYGMFTLTYEDKTFAYSQGQPAQPFLYPAFTSNKDKVVQVVANTIKKGIKEAIKND